MSTFTEATTRASEFYRLVLARYADSATPQRNALIIALVVVVILALCLVAAIALVPSRRKVVRKRRVRRVRRKVVGQPIPRSAVEPAEAVAGAVATPEVAVAPEAARRRRGMVVAGWAVAWIVLMALSVAAIYVVTGSNSYCGESCHAANPRVAIAVKDPHAKCIECHESGPVSGSVARVRMALARSAPEEQVVATPVDPDRCLRCHGDIASVTVKTKSRLDRVAQGDPGRWADLQ